MEGTTNGGQLSRKPETGERGPLKACSFAGNGECDQFLRDAASFETTRSVWDNGGRVRTTSESV
jgi:hypothetical protein